MGRCQTIIALLLASQLGACSRCGRSTSSSASQDIAAFLPTAAEAILVVPDLGQLGAKLILLEKIKLASLAAQLQGFSTAQEYVSALMNQAGVDLHSKGDLARLGIDPGRALAVARLPSLTYAVVAVGDRKKFEEALAALARNRLGAEVKARRDQGPQTLLSFSRAAGTPVLLGALLRDSFALVAAGEPSELTKYASLPATEAFAANAALSAALARLPAERDLYLHVPARSGEATSFGVSGVTVSASVSARAIGVHVDFARGNGARALAALRKRAGPSLVKHLPVDAFLVGGFSGDPQQLDGVWPRLLGPQVTQAIEQSGVDFKEQVLSNLKPGAAASLSLAPTAVFSGLPEMDVRRANPFQVVQLVALAEVNDSPRARETLSKVPAIAAKLGARVATAVRGGRSIYVSEYSQGEGAHFAALGDKVVVASPLSRMDAVLARLGVGGAENSGPVADSAMRKLFEDSAVAAVLDFPRLIKSIKDLPASAWGVGGFAIKATIVRWLDAMEDLEALTAAVSAQEGAVAADIELRLLRP